MTNEDEVLVAEHLSRRYGAVVALADAFMTLRRGEVMALVGDNGAGKSTMLKILRGRSWPTPDPFASRARGSTSAPSTLIEPLYDITRGAPLGVYAALMIGGHSITRGGVGNPLGGLFGLLVVAAITNILNVQFFDPDYLDLIVAAILLIAVLLERFRGGDSFE